MTTPEQQLPPIFIDFFNATPGLFEPLKDLPSLKYEPSNENERILLTLIKDHEQRATEGILTGRFHTMQALRSPGQVLTVYREILGRILGEPLEGGVRVGISTGIIMPNEFEDIHNVFAVINSRGRIDRMVTSLGSIYPGLLTKHDKSFLEENYFPVNRIPEIIGPYLRHT